MKSKKAVIISILIIFFIFILLKLPNDNKDLAKFNELDERINEIEKLIKSSRRSFDVIKQALLDMNLNKDNVVNLNNVKSLLKTLQLKSQKNRSQVNLEWRKPPFHVCDVINITKSDIDLLEMHDSLDFTDIDGGVWKQGFDLKYNTNLPLKMKVFVVPHSHLDPGWIKTVDEYFNSQTKPILDSMLQFLIKEPEMKFIHAEISFFQMWWETLNENNRKNVKRLVKNKQLEIVTGGWVMTDEASSHYFSILNQLTDGHLWLKEHLDYSPKSSWSIDPFGYSESVPYILQKSGIDNLIIQRVHYIIKKNLALKKQLEFLWKQSWDTSQSYNMLCQIMPFFSYDIPHTCGPDPSICCQFDFIRKYQFGCPWGHNPVEITDENVDERARTLMDQYRKKSELFDNGNVLLIPLGDDFRYQTENEWKVQFDNYKKLMNYINNKKVWNMEIKFATLSEYFEAFDSDKKKNLPTLTGNMFSYADRLQHYWTGYFTSRPMLKNLDRILMSHLRSAEIAFSLALIYQQKYGFKSSNVFNVSKLKDDIRIARRTLSSFQHHDAITGTSTRHVVEDFGNKLVGAIHISQDVFLKSAQRILEKNVENTQLDNSMFDLDELIKSYGQEKLINYVDLIVNKERYIYLFNALSQPRQVVVHIPIKNNIRHGIKIMGSGNQILKCQLSPSMLNNKGYNQDLHYASFKLNIGPLAFEQVQIIVSEDIYSDANCAPVEIHFYNMKDSLDSKIAYKTIKHTSDENKFVIIENLINTLYISTLTGNIEKIKGYYSDNTHEFKVRFKKYGVKNAKETSGAYIFLPDGNGKILKSEESPLLTHFKGNVFEEVHINHKYVTQKINIYRVDGSLANAIDIENIVDIRETNNFELSMALMTASVAPSDIFYTDSNCFQFVKRKTLLKLPIQGNVYPMSCGSFVQSNTVNDIYRMSLFSKQSNGVMGGEIAYENKTYSFLEVFQDRKLDQDDNRGLFEPVIDNVVTPVKFRIVFEGWRTTSSMSHNEELTVASYQLLNDLTYPIHQLHIKPDLNSKVSDNLISQKSMLTGLGLSCDYHMVNLRTDDNDLPKLTLHRLKLNCESKFISKGSCNVSQRKSVLFKSIFDDLSIKSVHRAHLTGTYLNTIRILPEDVKVNTMEMETFVLLFELK